MRSGESLALVLHSQGALSAKVNGRLAGCFSRQLSEFQRAPGRPLPAPLHLDVTAVPSIFIHDVPAQSRD